MEKLFGMKSNSPRLIERIVERISGGYQKPYHVLFSATVENTLCKNHN